MQVYLCGSSALISKCRQEALLGKQAMRYWVLLIWVVLWVPKGWTQTERIQAGDSLKITVEEDESLSQVYPVDSQGNLQMPLIGLVKVAGLTPQEAAQTIARLLKEGRFFRDPKVTVERVQPKTPTISIGGAVRVGGSFKLEPGWRLSDALKAAGTTEQADLSAVRLERADGTLLSINYQRFLQQNDPTFNPLLQAGDRIFVPIRPSGDHLLILGAVQKPGIVPFEQGLTLAGAIQKAGGATPEADLTKVRLKRKESPEELTVNLTVPTGDLELQPGDQVVVPFRAAKQFIVVRGAVRQPGLIPYTENLTLTRALEAAGGPTAEARLERVLIERPAGKRKQKITVNLLEVAQGRRHDEVIQPGDVIEVPGPPRRTSAAETLQLVWLLLSLAFLLSRR